MLFIGEQISGIGNLLGFTKNIGYITLQQAAA